MSGFDQARRGLAGDQEGGVVAVIDLALVALRQAVADPEHAGRDLARHPVRHRRIEHGLGVSACRAWLTLLLRRSPIARHTPLLTIPTYELGRCQHRCSPHMRIVRASAVTTHATMLLSMLGPHATAPTTIREGADDQFEPTHHIDDRRRRRGDGCRIAGVRPSAAGRSAAGRAGRRQGRILREGQRPHPLRRDRLRLSAAGGAGRRLELAHRDLVERGDQHHGGVQERLPRDHHGPAQRHQRRIHRPGPGRRSLGRVRRRPARR